jgi:hypothetical protein
VYVAIQWLGDLEQTDRESLCGLGPAPSVHLSVGYAFVNFVRPWFITNFVQRRVG